MHVQWWLLFWASRADELGLLESGELKSSRRLCWPCGGRGWTCGAYVGLLASEVASTSEQTSAQSWHFGKSFLSFDLTSTFTWKRWLGWRMSRSRFDCIGSLSYFHLSLDRVFMGWPVGWCGLCKVQHDLEAMSMYISPPTVIILKSKINFFSILFHLSICQIIAYGIMAEHAECIHKIWGK